LPEKIKDVHRENDELKMTLTINKRKIIELEEKADYNNSEL